MRISKFEMGMKKHVWTVLLGVGFCACCCAAAELEETYSLSNGISFSLPSDWEMIPEDVLHEMSRIYAESNESDPLAAAKFDVVFQRSGADHWFSYPYVSIHVNEEGRIAERVLSREEEVPWKNIFLADVFSQDVVSLLCETNRTFELFDPDTASIYSINRSMTDASSEVVGLSVARLTEQGFVIITCSFLLNQSTEFQHLCAEIAASLTIPSEMKYQFDEYTYRRYRHELKSEGDAVTVAEAEADNFGQWFVPFCAMLGGSIAAGILKLKKKSAPTDEGADDQLATVMGFNDYVKEWRSLWQDAHPALLPGLLMKELGTIEFVEGQRVMHPPLLTTDHPAVELLHKVKTFYEGPDDLAAYLTGDLNSSTGTLGRYMPPGEMSDHVSLFILLTDRSIAMLDLKKGGSIDDFRRFKPSERQEVQQAFIPVDESGCPVGFKEE